MMSMKNENKKTEIKVVLIIALLIITAIISIYAGWLLSDCDNEIGRQEVLLTQKDANITNLNKLNQELSLRIIGLQENEKYSKALQDNATKTKNDLQDTYNKLFTSAVDCYWANACLYYPTACSNHFEGAFVNYTAQDIHDFYSNKCEDMWYDWEKYLANDTSYKGE